MPSALRPYRPEDRAAMAQVFFRAVREGSAAHYSEAERAAWAPSPTPDWDKPDKLLDQDCLVAEEAGRMTGFFSMDATGYLDMAFVIPEVMGNGTAAALYEALMARARARGLTRFTVRAAEQSRRFLARRGWAVLARERLEDEGAVFHIYLMALEDRARADRLDRVVRAYRPEDRAAVALVRFRAIREGSVDHYSQEEREGWAPIPEPDWAEADKFLGHFCFVCEAGGQMTGFMAMDRTGFLDSAYVIPEAMGDGTAAVIYDRLMQSAREAGLRTFSVHAVENSRRFLARRGWQFDGLQDFTDGAHRYKVNLMSLDQSRLTANPGT